MEYMHPFKLGYRLKDNGTITSELESWSSAGDHGRVRMCVSLLNSGSLVCTVVNSSQLW